MASDISNIPNLVRRSRSLQEKMTSREGSLWLAALNREKAIIDQNHSSNNVLVPGSSSGDTDLLFHESADYDVDEEIGEFDNNNYNCVYKRKHEGDLGRSMHHHPTVLTCENTLCPYSQPHLGFHDRNVRESHQMICPYRAKSFYQPTQPFGGMSGLMAPYPGYNNRSFHGGRPENQVAMQQQVQIQDQFNPLNRPKAVQRGGGNNGFLCENRLGLVDAGLVVPSTEYSGSVETGGMESSWQNQEEDLPLAWG